MEVNSLKLVEGDIVDVQYMEGLESLNHQMRVDSIEEKFFRFSKSTDGGKTFIQDRAQRSLLAWNIAVNGGVSTISSAIILK